MSSREVTASAEIYRPASNSWTATGPLLAPRSAAAVLLKSEIALVAGSQTAGKPAETLEIYDPDRGAFELALGSISPPRTTYALAVLEDGLVLIAGGLHDGRALDNIDLFDPERRAIYPAGRMLAARANFTATVLHGGAVLLAGGTDGQRELASAELYDPASGAVSPAGDLASGRPGPSRHFGSTVLIAAGTADGKPLDTAELYVIDRKSFQPAVEPSAKSSGANIAIASVAPDNTVRNFRFRPLRRLRRRASKLRRPSAVYRAAVGERARLGVNPVSRPRGSQRTYGQRPGSGSDA